MLYSLQLEHLRVILPGVSVGVKLNDKTYTVIQVIKLLLHITTRFRTGSSGNECPADLSFERLLRKSLRADEALAAHNDGL